MPRKKQKQTKKKKKKLFYVGINKSIDVRRNILESTREFVQVLQMYENFSRLRKDINGKVEILQKDMRKIKNLNAKLKKILPETGLRAAVIKKKKAKSKKKEKKVAKPKKVQRTELDELEAELNSIEMKLSKIR